MRHCREHLRRFTRSASWVAAGLVGLTACAPRAPAPVGPQPGREPLVRVGIVVDTTQIQLSAPGTLEVRDAETGQPVHIAEPAQSAIVRVDERGELWVRVGETEMRGGTAVVAAAEIAGLVRIGEREYRGSALIRATGPGRLTVINQVGMEDYLLGVVPQEIGRVGIELFETAKAQAVAARTYAVRYLGRRAALGFDVFATTADQVYGGYSSEHEPVSRAVVATAGEMLTYNAEPIDAFYHSTCSGQTAAIEEVWPREPRRPYLISVVDVNPATGVPFDSVSSRFRWTQRWTADELRRILSETLADSLPQGVPPLLAEGVTDVGELREFHIVDRTVSGRIRTMRIVTDAGEFQIGADPIRWAFRTPQGAVLNSSKFDIATVRGDDGRIQEVVAYGAGWGHGIGMCQVGAMGRARAGQDYRTILNAYYPGTTITDLY